MTDFSSLFVSVVVGRLNVPVFPMHLSYKDNIIVQSVCKHSVFMSGSLFTSCL